MNKELRTMEEKQKLDPNEMMENGLTRQQNEEQQQNIENGANIINVIVLIISLVCMFTALQGLL